LRGAERLQHEEGSSLTWKQALLLRVVEKVLPVKVLEGPGATERVHGSQDACIHLSPLQQKRDVLQGSSPADVASENLEGLGPVPRA
jgi:hypothetical protein